MILCLKSALLHRAQRVAGDTFAPLFTVGTNDHLLGVVQGRHVDTSRQEDAVLHGHGGQRRLQPVIDLPEESRPELDRQHFAALLHRIADGNAACVLS